MTTTTNEQQFAEAVAIANIPTLLMVLVQLTGERHWMEPPYRPTRARGMGDNDTGGLPEPIQQEIREAALEAILAWRAGRPVAIPEPSSELLVEMLSCAMGEHVPPEYGPMIAAQLGLRLPFTEDRAARRARGLPGAHRRCRRVGPVRGRTTCSSAGIPFVDRREERHRRRHVAGQPLPGRRRRHAQPPLLVLVRHLRLVDVLRAARRAARLPRARRRLASASATACGSAPRSSRRPTRTTTQRLGRDRAPGRRRHRDAPRQRRHQRHRHLQPAEVPRHRGARPLRGPVASTPPSGRRDLDLTGKRVAIIGNGASAMQIGPEIQDTVASLTIFQRSPHWAAPFEQFRKRGARAAALPAARGAALPVVVPDAPRLDVQRPDPPGAAEGPDWDAPGAVAERHQRRPPRLLHAVHPRRAR